MKVVIEARLPDPQGSGGVSQAIISLATALSGLKDCRPGEEFVFVTRESAGDWLDAHVAGNCRLHKIPMSAKERIARSPLGPLARALWRLFRTARPAAPQGVVQSDGLAESLGARLVHFPTQDGYLTALPSIYQPHDLQHLHLPDFFKPDELAWRNLVYPVYCRAAALVLVESSWTKDDVVQQYGIAPENVAVCPYPPATAGYRQPSAEEIAALRRKLRHTQFIFYPANTWPHKNHLRLIEALGVLKAQGITVPLVCTGAKTALFSEIEAMVARLGLADQVQFLGYVSKAEIKSLYHLCTAVVVPTKFESVSFPIWEAFEAGKPVACSTVTSLPAQVGEAGLTFDADDPTDMARAIRTLWDDADLRDRLGKAGTQRLRQFSLNDMALHIRAMYRQLAGTLDDDDRKILAAKPLI